MDAQLTPSFSPSDKTASEKMDCEVDSNDINTRFQEALRYVFGPEPRDED